VTDRCNFRCLYCMPVEGLQWLPNPTFSRTKKLVRSSGSSAPLGLKRLRITWRRTDDSSGSRAAHRDVACDAGHRRHRAVDERRQLPEIARTLRDAGLERVNIPRTPCGLSELRRLRGQFGFDPVRSASAAEDAGLGPIKLNVVVMRGINDDEIEDFARLTIDHAWHVRFIELMPVGDMRELTWEHRCAKRRDSRP